jgi:phosphate transport system protein
MSIHLEREIEKVKGGLLSLYSLVEEQLQRAAQALQDRDATMARTVERRDLEVDQREVELEEECLKVLALYQPVASDLRFVVSVLKMNSDLERIGDLAVNIAKKALAFCSRSSTEIPFDVVGMWQRTQSMLRDSLDALVNLDASLANNVRARDSEVDRMKREIRRKAEELMQSNAESLPTVLTLLAVSRNLERVADHATNIAEDVIYMVEGRIIRHGAVE